MLGWLSPEGDFYPCGFMEHVSLLFELYSFDILQTKEEFSGIKIEEQAEELGWWKLALRLSKDRGWLGGLDATQKQRRVIKKWYKDLGREFPGPKIYKGLL